MKDLDVGCEGKKETRRGSWSNEVDGGTAAQVRRGGGTSTSLSDRVRSAIPVRVPRAVDEQTLRTGDLRVARGWLVRPCSFTWPFARRPPPQLAEKRVSTGKGGRGKAWMEQ